MFQHEFASALAGADRAIVAEPYFKPSDPLADHERLDVDEVIAAIGDMGRDARTLPDADAILASLIDETRAGDVVVFMSNGAFGGLPRRFAEKLGGRAGEAANERDAVG